MFRHDVELFIFFCWIYVKYDYCSTGPNNLFYLPYPLTVTAVADQKLKVFQVNSRTKHIILWTDRNSTVYVHF